MLKPKWYPLQKALSNLSSPIIFSSISSIVALDKWLLYFDYGLNYLMNCRRRNQTITITAADVNENPIYNWYNANGNLAYQGKDLPVSADVITRYKI